MNELALFAGAGGGLLGTGFIGLQTICAVELDWHCRCVLLARQNMGELGSVFPIWDDIRSFDGRAWRGRVDVVSGGFPCQAFSTAARGRNNAENLWPEMRRVINEVEPEYVFAENVQAAAIEKAADDCAEMGYKTEMLSLSAADLGGDHVRSRYWLLAYANNKSELCSTINAEMAKREGVCGGVWATRPDRTRVDDGLAGRMERYKATGNGQVPIVAASALWALANAE
ncbi:MAG: DNA cytosine methyltransferase [Porticoccus sp.]|uniref:DNA cytosine methyltransferase n=1 Tax=Porticoccus sp. TaxID=2024853 RepID=UPI003298D1CF